MSIYQKLSNIQRRLIAPKGQRNDFGKYNYRSCEDIVKALKPLCDEENCVVYMTNNIKQVGDRIYIEATVTLADLESDAVITSVAQAREEADKKGMDGSQITGASSSYARKYALAGLFMIDNEKDSDATNNEDSDATNNGEKKADNLITPKQKAEILHEVNRTHVSIGQICTMYKVESIDDIPSAEFTKLMQSLKAYPDYEAKE